MKMTKNAGQSLVDVELKVHDVVLVNGLRRYRVDRIVNGFTYTVETTPDEQPENKNGHCWHQLPDPDYPGMMRSWACCFCGLEGQFETTIPEGHGPHFVGNRVAAGGRVIFNGNLMPCPNAGVSRDDETMEVSPTGLETRRCPNAEFHAPHLWGRFPWQSAIKRNEEYWCPGRKGVSDDANN